MNDSSEYPYDERHVEDQRRRNRRPLLLIPLVLLVVLVGFGIRHFQKKASSDILTSANSSAGFDSSGFTPPPSAAESTVKSDTNVDTKVPATVSVAESAPPSAPVSASLPSVTPPKKSRKHVEASFVPSAVDSSSSLPTPASNTVSGNPSTMPHKSFALEDQPLPPKASLSEEGELAMNTMPQTAEVASETLASPVLSEAFKQGMEAYHRQDYAGAIAHFGELPKPTTRQRGNPTRDQYVQGNFQLGLSYLQVDRAADAVNAFLTVLDYEKYYPLANMNLGICYVELKQYSKANKAFDAVVRDQGYIDSPVYDDVMQRTKYFWALAWTRMYRSTKDADKKAYYQQQALLRWKDYEVWFGKDARYRAENRRAEGYANSLSTL